MARDKTDTTPVATTATNEAIRMAVAYAKKCLNSNILQDAILAEPPIEEDLDRMGLALKQALTEPDTNDFDAGVSAAVQMLREGSRLPVWLATFAADVLEGKQKRPTKRGKDKYQKWQRDYAISRVVDIISSQFNLPKYTNNELSNKVTAAEIVAEAADVSLDVVIIAYKKFGGKINHEKPPQDK